MPRLPIIPTSSPPPCEQRHADRSDLQLQTSESYRYLNTFAIAYQCVQLRIFWDLARALGKPPRGYRPMAMNPGAGSPKTSDRPGLRGSFLPTISPPE